MSTGRVILACVVVGVLLLALVSSRGSSSTETQPRKDFETKMVEHETLLARQKKLMGLRPGMRFTCNGITYTVGPQGAVLSDPIQLPLHRAALRDGTSTPKVLFLQVYNMGYNGIWIATQINFRADIPNIVDPKNVTWQGRTFAPGLWGSTYYKRGSDEGICRYLKYNATDTPRGEYGTRHKGDELYFEKLGDGEWRVYFRTEYTIRDIIVAD